MKMENRNLAQRYAIFFCVKLKESATVTYGKLMRAFGTDVMSRSQVFRWYKMFQEGRTSIEDEQRSGRPSTKRTDDNAARVKELVRSDPRVTIRMMSDELEVSKETVRRIVGEDLEMRKICGKLVPKNLSEQQRDERRNVAEDIQEQLTLNPKLINQIITGGECWFFDSCLEQYSDASTHLPTESPERKKICSSKSKAKCMLICFFDCQGIIHQEWVPPDQIVDQWYYREVLERLCKNVLCVRSNFENKWILHLDTTPPHNALMIRQFLTSKGIVVLPQPPFSPDLCPSDFFLFTKVKSVLKGITIETVEDIQRVVTQAIVNVPECEFRACFSKWQDRWQMCVRADGNYFEFVHSSWFNKEDE